MNTNDTVVELTPAQVDFCTRHIKGYDPHSRQVSVAGKAGSDRSFLRIAPGDNSAVSYILVLWDSHDNDWERFLNIHDEVARSIPLLPEIYASDTTHGLILEEDCGRYRLKDFCSKKGGSRDIETMYRMVCDALIQWQQIPVEQSPVLSSRVLDKEMFLWETDYFAAHCVSEYFGLDALLTDEWHIERNRLADDAAALPLVCLHRDFQSENIMVHDNEVKFVDYQGARLGAAEYDIASLLFDPYVPALDDTLRYRLLKYYTQKSGRPVTHGTFHIAALQRLTQALGAYGNLSLHKGKDVYRDYIPYALKLLLQILDSEGAYPTLKNIVYECCQRTTE